MLQQQKVSTFHEEAVSSRVCGNELGMKIGQRVDEAGRASREISYMTASQHHSITNGTAVIKYFC